jgi:hypothetical protein
MLWNVNGTHLIAPRRHNDAMARRRNGTMAIDQCDERWGDDDGTITTDQLMTMTMM